MSFSLLGWHKRRQSGPQRTSTPATQDNDHIFVQHPAWQEINRDKSQAPDAGVLYASPFNPEVRQALKELMSEAAYKFTTISGLALDVRLDDREILGYSEAAREAAILSMQTDPIDITPRISRDNANNDLRTHWILKRTEAMNHFAFALRGSYLEARAQTPPGPGGRVLMNGRGDYYAQGIPLGNDLRLNQNWQEWIGFGVADGILLEGRWLPRYNDAAYLHGVYTNKAQQARVMNRHEAVMPVLSGAHIVKDANYLREKNTLQSRVPMLKRMMLQIRDDEDVQRAVALLSGDTKPFDAPPLKVGDMVPDVTLQDDKAKPWSPLATRGKQAMLWLLAADANAVARAKSALQSWKTAAEPLAEELGIYVISPRALPAGTLAFGTNLVDGDRELLRAFGANTRLVLVDKAGFVRHLEGWPSTQSLSAVLPRLMNTLPQLTEGQAAPDFAFTDMNGNVVRLQDLRGQKNLLLSFFPKCFTGG